MSFAAGFIAVFAYLLGSFPPPAAEAPPVERLGPPGEGVTRLAFGSCASDARFKTQPVWDRVREARPAAFFALGDTPYIDTTDPQTQRRRYREFFAMPEVAALRREVPYYATWDDHDFGLNDTDGRLIGKEHSRAAFVEAMSPAEGTPGGNPSFGEDGEGIYTKVRVGAVDVFLIDARWFAGTEPSFADPETRTLIGRRQWEWLRRELKASDAVFKVLASGMIWNDAVRPNKKDYWGAYPHERGALMRFIAEEAIGGVVLMGGDIHRSRALVHPVGRWGVPYPMHEFITSPMAQGVIAAANAPDEALVWDIGVEQTAMVLDVEGIGERAVMTARWFDHEGKVVHRMRVERSALEPAAGPGGRGGRGGAGWGGRLTKGGKSHLRDLNPGPMLYESIALPLS